ncbi:hypothetical protein [Thalassotalea fusca]
MKILTVIMTGLIAGAISGCSVLPIKSEIRENYFRFENFKRDDRTNLEYINLMCYRKKPIGWAEPKQYVNGEHNLWVKASVAKRGVVNSKKETVVNFNLTLDAGKSYKLNRKIKDNQIALWIEESDTGAIVSEVINSELKLPPLIDDALRKKQCLAGTI